MNQQPFRSYLFPLFITLVFVCINAPSQGQVFKKGYDYTLVSEGGRILGHFQEVIGLPTKPIQKHLKISSIPQYSNLTLKRGIFSGRKHYNWYKSTRMGRIIPKNIKIQKFNSQGRLIRQWIVEGAYPTDLSGFQMNPDGSSRAVYLKYKLSRCFVKSWSTSG